MNEKQVQQGEKLLTISELALFLNIKQKTIYARAEAGEIPHYHIGRLIRFRLDEIDAWLETCRNEKSQPRPSVKKRRPNRSTTDHFSKIIKKTIDEETDKFYSVDYGKSDRIEGLKKEVNNGSL
jgi:excisionase family DNA binding protein